MNKFVVEIETDMEFKKVREFLRRSFEKVKFVREEVKSIDKEKQIEDMLAKIGIHPYDAGYKELVIAITYILSNYKWYEKIQILDVYEVVVKEQGISRSAVDSVIKRLRNVAVRSQIDNQYARGICFERNNDFIASLAAKLYPDEYANEWERKFHDIMKALGVYPTLSGYKDVYEIFKGLFLDDNPRIRMARIYTYLSGKTKSDIDRSIHSIMDKAFDNNSCEDISRILDMQVITSKMSPTAFLRMLDIAIFK